MTQPLVYLDDYLGQKDFKKALRPLAQNFRKELGLPEDLDELGLVCPDVVRAADYLQKKYPGMGTFMLAEGSAERFDENGKPLEYRTRVGFAYYQDVLLELAEAGTGSDIFSSHLSPDGRITIHHMGYFSRGDEHEIAGKKYAPKLKALGYASPEWAAKVAAGMTIHVAIYNTYESAQNLSLEFLDFRLLGLPVDYPKKAAEAFGEFQNRIGPRVLVVPGHTGRVRLEWSLHGRAELARGPSDVWKYVTEPALLSAWWGLTVTAEASGEDPAAVGAKRHVQGKIEGETIDFVQTITESNGPMLLRYTTSNNGIFRDGDSVMTVTGTDNTCELVWQLSFVPEESLTGPAVMKRGNQWVGESLRRLSELLGGANVSIEIDSALKGTDV
jgi:hypothetical protein